MIIQVHNDQKLAAKLGVEYIYERTIHYSVYPNNAINNYLPFYYNNKYLLVIY